MNWLSICTSNLLFLYNVMIAVTITNKCLHFQVLGTKGIITIKVIMIEKY